MIYFVVITFLSQMNTENEIEKYMVKLSIEAENNYNNKKKNAVNSNIKEWKYVSQYEKIKQKNIWREATESDFSDGDDDNYESFYIFKDVNKTKKTF
jgi:hypothetical protein